MPSALDCAFLSEDVYNSNGNLAYQKGWTRLNTHRWGDGFAAELYERNSEKVIAFRGTDDMSDAIADARMMPAASITEIESVTPALLDDYGLSDRIELVVGSALLSQMFTHREARLVTSILANQAPPEQTSQAEDYLRDYGSGVVCLTGHSLGGALAKTISLQSNLSCAAFNSPNMGDLRGVPLLSSPLITSINARSDPLSFSTRQVGNLSHGRDILVTTDPYGQRPPNCPQITSYQRPTPCPRVPENWWASEQGIFAMMYSPICETAVDVGEVFGRATTYPVRNFQYWYQQRPEYIRALLNYLLDVAIHYHSMENLRVKMETMPQFQQPIL